MQKEFDRQATKLIQSGIPSIAKISTDDFSSLLAPLKEKVIQIKSERQFPFIIVIKSMLVPPEKIMPLIEIKGVIGEVRMTPLVPADFSPIDNLNIPEREVYLLADVDTEQKTLNLTPHDALTIIRTDNRYPLTIDEGISLVFQFPEVLTDKKKYNCFSASGSRRNDQRVPAFWMSYKKPRLGWCWDNNPHTWLGSASCSGRIG